METNRLLYRATISNSGHNLPISVLVWLSLGRGQGGEEKGSDLEPKRAHFQQDNDTNSTSSSRMSSSHHRGIPIIHLMVLLHDVCDCPLLDFEDILSTVAFLMRRNPSAEFWTTYQERR